MVGGMTRQWIGRRGTWVAALVSSILLIGVGRAAYGPPDHFVAGRSAGQITFIDPFQIRIVTASEWTSRDMFRLSSGSSGTPSVRSIRIPWRHPCRSAFKPML